MYSKVARICPGNNSLQQNFNAITFWGTTHPKTQLTHSTTNMEPRTCVWFITDYSNGQPFNLLALARMMPLRSLLLRCQKQLWRQSSLVLHLIAVEKYSLWEPNMEPHRFYFLSMFVSLYRWEERQTSWKSEFWRIDFSWLKSFCKSVDLLTFWDPTGRGIFLRRSHVMLYIVVEATILFNKISTPSLSGELHTQKHAWPIALPTWNPCFLIFPIVHMIKHATCSHSLAWCS